MARLIKNRVSLKRRGLWTENPVYTRVFLSKCWVLWVGWEMEEGWEAGGGDLEIGWGTCLAQ